MLRSNVLLSGCALVGLLLSAPAAHGFCRSTTCTGASCPRDENNCKTTGAKLFWPGLCVGFSLQRDGTEFIPMADVRPAIENAFYAWADVDCGGGTASISFAELSDVTCKQADYDASEPNANVVLFQDTKWIYRGIDNTLAKTTVTYDKETGEIFDADIEINHAYNEFSVNDDNVKVDLQSVVTHEVGHLIGLDHSPDFDATMFAGYTDGTIDIRTIEPDDMAAVCAAYPPDRAARCDPTPSNGLGDSCSGAVEEGDEQALGCSLAGGTASKQGAAGGAAVSALWLALWASRRKKG